MKTLLWDIARASAVIAYIVYTITLSWGMLLTGKHFRPASSGVTYHRQLNIIGLVTVFTHVISLFFDRFAHVEFVTLLGLTTTWGIRAGVLAFWLAIILPFSFVLRRTKHLSTRAWRLIHYSSYLFWLSIVIHSLTTGSDRSSLEPLYLVGVVAVVICFVYRFRPQTMTKKALVSQIKKKPALDSPILDGWASLPDEIPAPDFGNKYD